MESGFEGDAMRWKDILKEEEEIIEEAAQTKLPEELTEGATVATRPLKDWFKPNRKKQNIQPIEETNTQQTSLEDFS